MRKSSNYSLIAGFILAVASILNADENRVSKTVNEDWRFHKGDIAGAEAERLSESDWVKLSLPHTWNTDLIQGKGYYCGPAWYRKELDLPDYSKSKRYFLRFDGALMVTDLFVNGRHVGQHRGGYAAFCFEVTGFLKPGVNLIAVKVNNAFNKDITPAANNLFTRFGGIYRPVRLIVTSKVCITPLDYASSGVYISQKNVSEKKADVTVLTKISNGDSRERKIEVRTVIRDASGKAVITVNKEVKVPAGETLPVVQSCVVKKPHLWNAKSDPYLYSVTVSLLEDGKKVDAVTQPLGLRYYRVDSRKGFFLNGKHIDLHGVCRHQEWEHEGSALSDAQHEHDINAIMELGANAVRLAHYQQAETIYRLCDQKGLIVWAEVPVTPPYEANNPRYFANCRQQLTELIRQNYNHPSICFWSLYNEVPIPGRDVQALYDLAKKEDPYRLVTAASCRALQKRHTITDLIAFNKYPYWYGGRPISTFIDNVHKRYPDMRVGISEYGAGGCIDQHQQHPKRPNPVSGKFFPEEYESEVHEKVWADIKDRDDIWCKFIWNMFDFSWPIVNRGNRRYENHKGLITYDRKVKKDAFFFYKSNWNKAEPVLYITSRRHKRRKEKITDVKIYSNAGKVELIVNGKSLGEKACDDICRAIWKGVELRDGDNTIEAKAMFKGKPLTDRCVWNLKEPDMWASASDSESGNTPDHAIDGMMNTRWGSGEKDPVWTVRFKDPVEVSSVEIAWFDSDQRVYPFEIEVSADGKAWRQVFKGKSSGNTAGFEEYKISPQKAGYLRIKCHGNSKTRWSSFWEVKIK